MHPAHPAQRGPAPVLRAALRLLAAVRRPLAGRWSAVRRSAETGMSTAEYAVGTVAACAFAAVLFKVVTGGSIVSALGRLITSALDTLS
jgi:hypothetical protein